MCVTRPARVVAVAGDRATVIVAGHAVEVDTRLVGAIAPGDRLLIHAGLALQTIDADEAREMEEMLALLGSDEEGS
jgi:hydrogenase expression/formation protein HypC